MAYEKCAICGGLFKIPKWRVGKAKYCSIKCQHQMLKNTGGVWKGKKRSKKTIKRMKLAKNNGQFKKGHIPWSAGKKIGVPVNAFGKGHIPWNKGKTGVFSEETLQKIRDARARQTFPHGKDHWHWKDVPAYSAVHKWLVKEYGNPQFCEFCGIEGEYKERKDGSKFWTIEWSNKTGQYIKDRKHYFGLCAKCHINYDKGHTKQK
uniref:Uncharacterized protein n=1 Tax=viral metagenome TaxID=1070528 RepID=A0A6M3L8H8_9ZZZZ